MTFEPGQSGNPAGRPKGSVNKSTRLRLRFEKELPTVMKRVITAALDGDMQAAKLVIDRCIPTLRPEAASVTIPGVMGASLSDRVGAVLDAVAEGRLPPDVGASILSALANVSRTIEVADISRRLDLLEAEKNGTG